jgi:DnaK suppressor protein
MAREHLHRDRRLQVFGSLLQGEAKMTSHLDRDQLSRFERQLRERETQLLAELRSGEKRADAESFTRTAGEAPDSGDASFADIVTDIVSAERQRDSDELREVQEALGRVKAGSYGLCLKCGKPIDPERLAASPAARYDVEHQSQQERQQGSPAAPTL